MNKVNQDERARRLQEAMRQKEEQLAHRRAAASTLPSLHRIQNLAAISLAAAALAWMTGFPAGTTQALGLIGDALATLADLQPLFLGVALGCLFAGFRQLSTWRTEKAAAAAPQPASLMLWLSVLVLALNVSQSFA